MIYLVLLLAFDLQSQDKLFFLDGSTKTGKVTEIGPEQITLKINNENNLIQKSLVLLIEFKNGSCDIINVPTENITHVADKKENFHFKQSKKEVYNYNQVSLNSLALCNADVSVFYERILPIKKIGIGVMGAYNFNLYANTLNSNIAISSFRYEGRLSLVTARAPALRARMVCCAIRGWNTASVT